MNRNEFRFAERVRVRWAEVDSRRAVFQAHYLTYFDMAIAGYWRALGVPLHDAEVKLGGHWQLGKALIDYQTPARLDDLLDVALDLPTGRR